jgi:hypothetical protein
MSALLDAQLNLAKTKSRSLELQKLFTNIHVAAQETKNIKIQKNWHDQRSGGN